MQCKLQSEFMTALFLPYLPCEFNSFPFYEFEILTFFKIITRMLLSCFWELWMQLLRKQLQSSSFVWNLPQIMNFPQGFIDNFSQRQQLL